MELCDDACDPEPRLDRAVLREERLGRIDRSIADPGQEIICGNVVFLGLDVFLVPDELLQ